MSKKNDKFDNTLFGIILVLAAGMVIVLVGGALLGLGLDKLIP